MSGRTGPRSRVRAGQGAAFYVVKCPAARNQRCLGNRNTANISLKISYITIYVSEVLADEVGFEPTEGCPSLVFKTSALNHSATHPQARFRGGHPEATVARPITQVLLTDC